jgi:hypothetical protein
MTSIWVRFSCALAIVLLALSFVFSGSFASAPVAAADTVPILHSEFFGPAGRAVEMLAQQISALEATVSSFAQSFNSQHITTQELCVADQSGAQTCISKSELDSLIAAPNSAPQVQISQPTVFFSSSSSSSPPLAPIDVATSTATSTPSSDGMASSTPSVSTFAPEIASSTEANSTGQ